MGEKTGVKMLGVFIPKLGKRQMSTLAYKCIRKLYQDKKKWRYAPRLLSERKLNKAYLSSVGVE